MIWQGVSYSLGALAIPSLLALPSAKPAQHVFVSLQKQATLHLRALAALSVLSLNLGFALSPARQRHPYLLWTALIAGLAATPEFLFGQPLLAQDQDQVNGETVEQAVKVSQRVDQTSAAIGLVGFAMSIVGIWGDGA